MTKFEIGDKVRILDAKGISCAVEEGYVSGDVTELIKTPGGNLGIVGRCGDYPVAIHGTEFDYIEKVAEHVTKNQRLSALEQQVAELQAEVATLKQASKPAIKFGTGSLHISTEMDVSKVVRKLAEAIEGTRPLSANEQRKAIIAEAKAFVADVEAQLAAAQADRTQGNYTYQEASGYAKYNVNAEKRTVVALVHSKYTDKVIEKAIAKCAPDDVFNADIGKAIALGRALGLDVERFEQAVKPTEVVVGMAVIDGGDKAPYQVVPDFSYKLDVLSLGFCLKYSSILRITDDTGAQY